MQGQVRVARFYGELGIKEWLRLKADARARVVLHVHNRILWRFIRSGDCVLDVGCGPGRFTAELVRLGARVMAGDLSSPQISLARQAVRKVQGNGADIALFTATALPCGDASFDHTVCFGSVLSHLGDEAEAGLSELVRVTKAGGLVLISVQPTQNHYLAYIVDQVQKLGLEAVDRAMMRGEEPPEAGGIPWRRFSYEEVEALAAALRCDVVEIRASNVMATVENIPLLESIEQDERLWQAFLRWEEHLATMRGNTERGSHMIVVLRRRV